MNMKNNGEKGERIGLHESLFRLASDLAYAKDPRVVFALNVIDCPTSNIEMARMLFEKTRDLLVSTPRFYDLVKCRNYPFKVPDHRLQGEIPIGTVYNPIDRNTEIFGLNLSEINQNVLICGRSGSGKTTLISLMISGLLRKGIPFLIVDFKRDYSYLIRTSKNVLHFNWTSFKFNPLLPPGVTDIYWNQVFSDIFFNSCFNSDSVPTAAKSVFLDILCTLTSRNPRLRMHELDRAMESILADSKTSPGYKQSIRSCQSRIKALLRAFRQMFSNSFSMDEIIGRQVVLQLDGLSVEMQSFFVTLLFQWIFTWRMANRSRSGLKHCLIFDEAKMVFSSETASGASPISRLVSTAREYGEGLILGEQMPSCLGHAILANVYAQISLSLSCQKDIHSMAYSMGLDEEQRKLLNNLPLKNGICKMADRYTRPFLFRVPHLVIDKAVGDSEIDAYMNPKLISLELLYKDNEPAEVKPADDISGEAKSCPDTEKSEVPMKTDEFTHEETLLLNDIRNRPFIGVSGRYGDLGITNYMGNKVCRQLVEKGLIAEVKLKTSFRGRPETFYELTTL
ncbi:MAG: DUF87 domain-containing protein, partial [Lentisphaerae bacterium]|nr:DUF87 domain-containing protein [Lentisphaerota bacterium]